MGSGIRTLLILLVGGGTFLLSLIVLGAVGLDRVPYVQTPTAIFIATVALWPLVRETLAVKDPHPFVNWVAYNAALMLIFGFVMYTATTWVWARTVIESLK